MRQTAAAKTMVTVVALLAWTAVVGQLLLNFSHAPGEGKPYWLVPIDLFGYFTIWSNTLVALVATHLARGGGGESVFGRPATMAASVVYIAVVGVIYNVLLAGLNHPVGLGVVFNALLHMVVPLAWPLWWLVAVPRGRLGWDALLPSLPFPFAYCIVAMTKGFVTGKYAYFFLDVGKAGLPQVLFNITGLVLLFAGLMALLIAFDRRMGRSGAIIEAQ